MSQEEEWRLSDAEKYNDDLRNNLRNACTQKQIDRLLNPLEEKDEQSRNDVK